MDDDEEFDAQVAYTPAHRLRKIDMLIVGLEFARQMTSAIEDTLSSCVQLVAAHANYKFERDKFQQAAALEIETLTSGDDDD